MKSFLRIFMIVVVSGLILCAWDGFFILDEGQQAVITQFGAPVGDSVTEAGPHLKIPFVQKVSYFEKKLLIWDGDPNQIPTSDKTYIFLDVTARWRIVDALKFLQTVKNETRAQTILDGIIDGSVRDLVNKNKLVEIIRSSDWEPGTTAVRMVEKEADAAILFGRDKIAKMVHEAASKITLRYGIELVDVMFKRVNYIKTVQRKVFDRMISERKRIAAEKRAMGEGEKAEILGKVERELKEITSKATREAQVIKGDADAEASRIYAEAYSNDPEFYTFLKTLESYEETMGNNTRLVVSSDLKFYKFLDLAE